MATTAQGSDFDRAKGWGKKFLADWKAAQRQRQRPEPVALRLRSPRATSVTCSASGTPGLVCVRAMGQNSPASPPGDRHGRRRQPLPDSSSPQPADPGTAPVGEDRWRAHPCDPRLIPGRWCRLRPRPTCCGQRVSCGPGSAGSGTTAPTAPRPRRAASSFAGHRFPPSAKWSSAIALGKAMADISEQGSAENSAYFRTKAGVMIAAILHAAALGDKPMMWLLKAVNGERRILEEAEEILDSSFEDDTEIALSDLRGILELDERSKGPIFSTTANAFAAYRLPGALDSTKNVNFDPAAFVAGDPEAFNPLRVAEPAGEDEPRLRT